MKHDEARSEVRKAYAAAACGSGSGCGCGGTPESSLALGYSEEDLAAVPDGANLGLGCGNPQAIAAIREGETVLDLGSGAGFDCFLAARRVGAKGRVIGVDMTPEMLSKARANAAKIEAKNVEFRLGEIERLPVANDAIDVIVSNCVINLSPDKEAVFREAFRVLVPGGRLAVSDIVLTATLPDAVMKDVRALTGCVAGAADIASLESFLRAAGFVDIRIEPREKSREVIREWMPGSGFEKYVVSADIRALKPGGKACCGPECCA